MHTIVCKALIKTVAYNTNGKSIIHLQTRFSGDFEVVFFRYR